MGRPTLLSAKVFLIVLLRCAKISEISSTTHGDLKVVLTIKAETHQKLGSESVRLY